MKTPILLALLAASPTWADCPLAADLTTGIRVTEDTGTLNTFVAIGGSVVQQDGATTDNYNFRNMLAQGTHLLSLSDAENGEPIADTLISTAYSIAPNDMPRPQPSMTQTYDTTVTTSDGSYSETQTQSWGQTTTLTIGDCTYDMRGGRGISDQLLRWID